MVLDEIVRIFIILRFQDLVPKVVEKSIGISHSVTARKSFWLYVQYSSFVNVFRPLDKIEFLKVVDDSNMIEKSAAFTMNNPFLLDV